MTNGAKINMSGQFNEFIYCSLGAYLKFYAVGMMFSEMLHGLFLDRRLLITVLIPFNIIPWR